MAGTDTDAPPNGFCSRCAAPTSRACASSTNASCCRRSACTARSPKADLARLTQLSTQTVAIIVERLLDDDPLLKQDRVHGPHRPALGAAVAQSEGAFGIGVQVGGAAPRCWCSTSPATRHQQALQYDHPDPDVVLPDIATTLKSLRPQARRKSWSRVVGSGCRRCSSCPVGRRARPAAAPALAKWKAWTCANA